MPGATLDTITADDVAARRIHVTLDGPKPPADPLGRLIPPVIPPEPPDAPDTARYRQRSAQSRVTRQLTQLALLTGNHDLLHALRQHARATRTTRTRTR